MDVAVVAGNYGDGNKIKQLPLTWPNLIYASSVTHEIGAAEVLPRTNNRDAEILVSHVTSLRTTRIKKLAICYQYKRHHRGCQQTYKIWYLMPEFDRRVLEVLREPLESGRVTVSRAARQSDFPARFQLIAAMNPCPCGFLGHPAAQCRCTPEAVARYQNRISGPLLDRIDMQIEVGPVSADTLLTGAEGEPSAAIALRVEAALERQIARQQKTNRHLTPREIDRFCQPERAGQDLLHKALLQFHWSARAYHRVLRVARTIADLAGAAAITEKHVAEAIQFRRALNRS